MNDLSVLNYSFKNLDFFVSLNNNEFSEKLEFLGDGIINNFIITSIYKKFSQDKSLGQIARIKSVLISKNNFSLILKKLNLFTEISKNKSIKKKSDLLEILFGAIYLDSGYNVEEVKKIYDRCIEPVIFDIMEDNSFLDFKSILQSYSQRVMKLLPKYTMITRAFINKQHYFTIKLDLEKYSIIASGNSLILAEQSAAKFLVKFLLIDMKRLY